MAYRSSQPRFARFDLHRASDEVVDQIARVSIETVAATRLLRAIQKQQGDAR